MTAAAGRWRRYIYAGKAGEINTTQLMEAMYHDDDDENDDQDDDGMVAN